MRLWGDRRMHWRLVCFAADMETRRLTPQRISRMLLQLEEVPVW